MTSSSSGGHVPAATITSSTVVDRPLAEVADLVDRLDRHREWTDHYITDWALSGPPRGVGATARVKVKGGASTITVVEVTPTRNREEGTGGPGGRWRTSGTYDLDPVDAGRTRVTFTNTIDAPTGPERVLARWALRRLQADNDRALERLAGVLGT